MCPLALVNNTAINMHMGFPDGSGGKEAACQAGDLGSIPGSGRSPGQAPPSMGFSRQEHRSGLPLPSP